MDRESLQAALERVDAFLALVRARDLLDYYGLPPDADDALVEQRIREKRAWAQSQQANPKYREQAIWLIKNHGLLRQLLLEAREDYLEALKERSRAERRRMLDLFIKGTATSGQLSSEVESALLSLGAELGLSESDIRKALEEASKRGSLPDHYAALEVSPDATPEQIERAYRKRYRWARSLKDKDRASAIYRELDEAWRVLSDPGRRAEYDRERAEQRAVADIQSLSVDELLQALGAGKDKGKRSARFQGASVEVQGVPRRRPPTQGTSRELEFSPGHSAQLKEQLGELPALHFNLLLSPAQRSFVLENRGPGALDATLTTEAPWLSVEPSEVRAVLDRISVTVTADPRRMPSTRARASILVKTARGERKSVQVSARRTPTWLLALLVLLLAGAAGAGWAAATGRLPLLFLPAEEARPEARTVLRLWVDPPAQVVLVNGEPSGSGAFLELRDPAPPGQPFTLRVLQDGFKPWEEQFTLQDGQELDRHVELELVDPMDFEPDEAATRAELDPAQVKEVVEPRMPRLRRCLPPTTGGSSATLRLRLDGRGRVRALEVLRAEPPVTDAVRLCLARQLRALSFPILSGDYADFELTVERPPSR